MEALVNARPKRNDENIALRRRSSLHADVLYSSCHRRGRARDSIGDERPLLKELPFTVSSGESAFLGHAKTLVDNWLGPLLQAFDAASEPDIASASHRLRMSVGGPIHASQGSQSYLVAQALCRLVRALEGHPNYRAWQGSHKWRRDPFAVKSRFLRGRFAYHRFRLPFRLPFLSVRTFHTSSRRPCGPPRVAGRPRLAASLPARTGGGLREPGRHDEAPTVISDIGATMVEHRQVRRIPASARRAAGLATRATAVTVGHLRGVASAWPGWPASPWRLRGGRRAARAPCRCRGR